MLSDDEFSKLLDRAKSGDQDAATELVRLYEPEIRRAARLRLTDPEMRRIVDSVDIAQSVFGRFFRTVESGSMELRRPEQLLALLTTMTRNRIIDEHRRRTALKRGGSNEGLQLEEVSDATPGPRTTAIAKDLLDHARSRLSDAELHIADRRNAGESWEAIGEELGESPEALRKRLERALARVREEIEASSTAAKKNL